MRPTNLKHRGIIYELSPDLQPVEVGSVWLGIIAKDASDVQYPAGLRNPAMIDIRARYSPDLMVGRYIVTGDRLLLITSVRDVMGNKYELRLSADEFVGQSALYSPYDSEDEKSCRVFIKHSAPYYDEMGAVTDYRTRIDVSLFEVGRPEQDDTITIGSDVYLVIEYAQNSATQDDGITRGLWVERT